MEDHNIYESLVETMNAGLAMIDHESRFTLVNNRFCRMVGYARDELMGRSTFELFDRKDRDLVAAQLQRRQKGEDQPYEISWLHKDGRTVPTIISPTPMFDDTGAYNGAVVTITEVTDVERIEYGLAESDERFHSLVDLMPDAVLVRKGQYIAFANAAASKLFGAERPDDLVGRDILDLVHPEDHPKLLERQRSFERDGKPIQSSDLKRLRLDGSIFYGEAILGPMDWSGDPAVFMVIRDTGESRRTEAALQESEERNRRLIEALPIAVMVRCGEEVVFVNRAAVAQMGAKSADALIGTQALDWVHADDRNLVLARRKEMARTGKQRFAEVKMQRLDGTVFYSSNILAPFVWEGRDAVLAINRDITERKEMEEALRRRESAYRQLVELNPDAVIVQCDGKVALANQRACAMFGANSKADLIGLDSLSLVHPDLRGIVLGLRNRVLDDQVPVPPTDTRHQRLDGTSFHSELTAGPVVWNRRPGTVNLIRDITQRKLAEDALRNSEARFRNLFENAPISIREEDFSEVNARIDTLNIRDNTDLASFLDRNPDFVAECAELIDVVDANRACLELHGVKDKNAFRANILRNLSDSALDMLKQVLMAVHRGETKLDFDTTVVRPDGSRRDVMARWSVARGYEKSYTRILFSSVDITDHKALEEQLRQSQKMEAVGQLTGGIAHDFNNLLAVVIGNLELLDERLKSGSDPADLAFRALTSAERGAELTKRLLAFSRRQALHPTVINTNTNIKDMIELLHRTLGEHIEIETVAATGLWNCEVDPVQLESALVNLAVNARDAMPDGGKLTIETANFWLDDDYAAAQAEVTPGQYVMLAVTDTGTGMSPEVREHVFEPFFTTKAVGAGSGLGLSMVYGFVKQSGGHVSIYSEEGEGTTVKLYLPRSTGWEAVERKPATDEVPVARGETVMVVEDDPDVRTLAVALLSSLGYQVMEAATGPAALKQLGQTTRVNLLVTDVVLSGGMSGRSLAAEVVRRSPAIKILYMSGYAKNAIVHHGRLDADVELLQKPFRKSDLARKVRAVLDGG